MSIGEETRDEFRHVAEDLAQVGSRTGKLADRLTSLLALVTTVTRGSSHPLVQQTEARLRRAIKLLGEAATSSESARTAVDEYMSQTGIGDSPSATSSPSTDSDFSALVEQARVTLPPGRVGSQTKGKWIGTDGVRQDLRSGDGDEWYVKARQLAASFPPQLRAASRLAVHLEVKFAVRMREEGRL
mgnify:CR=1 FL=1